MSAANHVFPYITFIYFYTIYQQSKTIYIKKDLKRMELSRKKNNEKFEIKIKKIFT